MKEKMISAFANAEGGLFSAVEKADVGSSYQDMEREGIALMGWADPFMPDDSMPPLVKEALLNAIQHPIAPHYTAPIGNPDLKQLIAQKLAKQNKLIVDPARNILITPGSDSGLYFSILPFIKDGDEVLVPTPSYPNNFLDIEIMGGVVVPVPLHPELEYQFVKEDFISRISDKTKMILITHPNNPTTTVFNAQSMEILRDIAITYDLILVCDQAFEDYCFEHEMITPAALPDMFERTITVFSFSKGMGLSGLRVAYVVCADTIMDTMYANAVGVLGATNTACQIAIMEALRHPSFMQDFETAFNERRHLAYDIINSIPNVSMKLPESGFLGWIDISKIGSSTDIVSYLIKEAKVSVNDGCNYGIGGDGHLRIVLGVYRDTQKVKDALLRIKHALIKWQEENHVSTI